LESLLDVSLFHLRSLLVNLVDENIDNLKCTSARPFVVLSPLVNLLDKLMDYLPLVLIGDDARVVLNCENGIS
jgi:hypothetical protein